MPFSDSTSNHSAPFSGRSTYTNHSTRAARSVTLLTWLAYSLICSLQPATAASQEYIEDSDHFPGWKGELPRETELSDGKIQVLSYGSLEKVRPGSRRSEGSQTGVISCLPCVPAFEAMLRKETNIGINRLFCQHAVWH